ncbi:Choline-binding protein precursor [Ewingella americana]|uniref:Choline-binding protein n=1 Tax=Ewingella americana TaxID=41202 RepID=A0A377NG12_9GAMM|nr:Choline-binding protein precursor [Ewingella americana]
MAFMTGRGRVRAIAAAATLAMVSTFSLSAQAADSVRVGSKIDTEGSLLGNLIVQVLEANGIKTTNKLQLGTTKVVRGAITAGEIDIYPEYTGNGAFFFSDEKDPAWKDAKAGFRESEKARL